MKASLCLLIPFLGHQLQILPAAGCSTKLDGSLSSKTYAVFPGGDYTVSCRFLLETMERELEGEKQAAGKNRKIQRQGR